jgi:hypothetical protein
LVQELLSSANDDTRATRGRQFDDSRENERHTNARREKAVY